LARCWARTRLSPQSSFSATKSTRRLPFRGDFTILMRSASSAVLQHVQRHLQRHSRALLPANLILSHYGQHRLVETLLLIHPYLIKTLQVAQRPRPPSHGEVKRREAQAKLSQQQAPNFLIKNQVDCIVDGTRKKGQFPKGHVLASCCLSAAL